MGRVQILLIAGSGLVLAVTGGTRSATAAEKFETYTEAISYLLDFKQTSGFNPVGSNVDDRLVTCRLFGEYPANEADRPTIGQLKATANYTQLSSALAAHCEETDPNSSSGAALGGGIGSTQSTRTVSQFETQSGTVQNQDEPQDQRFRFGHGLELALMDTGQSAEQSLGDSDFLSNWEKLELADDRPSGTIRWSSNDTALFFTYAYEKLEKQATRYEDGFESESNRFTGGGTLRLNDYLAIGVSGFYGEGDGKSDGAGSFIGFLDNPEVLGFYQALSFEEICGIPQGGKEDHEDYGGSVFGSLRSSNNFFINAELGLRSFKSQSSNSLCLLQSNGVTDSQAFPEVTRRLYRGLIEGKPEGSEISAETYVGRNFNLGILTMSPRLGAQFTWLKIDGYQETETSAAGAPVPNSTVVNEVIDQTGAALAYEERDFDSIQARLGFTAALNLGSDSFAIMPFGEAYFIHEFANDQQNVEARFVGDGRDEPLAFTFKTNEPDRNYFQIGGGLTARFADIPIELGVGVQSIVGNSLYDYIEVEGGLRILF